MDPVKSSDAELTRIRTLLEVLSSDISEVKSKVDTLTALDKKVSELQIHYEDEVKEDARMDARLAIVEKASQDFATLVNKAKGALALVVFLQTALIGGATWLVSSTVDHGKDISVIQHQLSSMHEYHRIDR